MTLRSGLPTSARGRRRNKLPAELIVGLRQVATCELCAWATGLLVPYARKRELTGSHST